MAERDLKHPEVNEAAVQTSFIEERDGEIEFVTPAVKEKLDRAATLLILPEAAAPGVIPAHTRYPELAHLSSSEKNEPESPGDQEEEGSEEFSTFMVRSHPDP